MSIRLPPCFALAALLLAAAPARSQDAPVATPAIIEEPDLQYAANGADSRRNSLDLYLPAGDGRRPVVVFVHGGSWTMGSKEQHAFVGRFLARHGFAAAVVNYRLFPFARWPAFAEDCAAACAFVAAHADDYGLDVERLFLMGHSAGAQIAGTVAFAPQWLQAAGAGALRIRGFIGLSGPYDVRPPLPQLARIFGDTPADRAAASPITSVGADEPPALLTFADRDIPNLALSARMFAARLRIAGNDVELLEQRSNHIRYVFDLDQPDSTLAPPLLQFLRRHSAPGDLDRAASPSTPAHAAAIEVRRRVAVGDGADAQRLDLWLPGADGDATTPLVIVACSEHHLPVMEATANAWARQGLAVAVAAVPTGVDGGAKAALFAACTWLTARAGELRLSGSTVVAGCGDCATAAVELGVDAGARSAAGFDDHALRGVVCICPSPIDAADEADQRNVPGPPIVVLHPAGAAIRAAARPGRISLPPGAVVPVLLPLLDADAMLRAVGSDADELTPLLLGLHGG